MTVHDSEQPGGMDGVRLVVPAERWLPSYRVALEEFRAAGKTIAALHDPDTYDQWKPVIFQQIEDRRLGRNLPEGWVPESVFWLVDGNDYLGTGSLRHRLTPALEQFGGNIGYAIRPSRWNMGYGTEQLRLLLVEARALGLSKVLLTCDDSNIASARVMENNGAVLQDTIDADVDGVLHRERRYWITLS